MLGKGDVREIYRSLETYYANMHQHMHRAERMYKKDFSNLSDIPYEIRIFESATGSNIIESFRNQIKTDQPTVIFRPPTRSKRDESHAILLQRWGQAQLRQEQINSRVDPTLVCAFHLLLRGAACKKVIVDVDMVMPPPPKKGTAAYMDWEFKARQTWPFVTRAIDPLSVFPAPNDRRPLDYIIEKQTRTAGEIKRMYPEWMDKEGGRNPARRVEWLEYWSEDEYVCEADGGVVFSRENPYGFVPYIFEWSGLGADNWDNDPSNLAVGVMDNILGELEQEVRLKTAISVQTQMHVFPPILTTDDPLTVAQQFGVGPGKVIQHKPGYPPDYMRYPEPNENLYRFLATIHANIARLDSAALSGGREPGVDYGVLQAQMIGQSLKAIAPVVSTIDRIGTQTLNIMSRLSNHLDLHQVVSGMQEMGGDRVMGSDFKHENFEVTFEVVDPAENDRRLLVGMSLRRNGDLSQQTLWEKFAKHVVEDAEEEVTRLLEEKVLVNLVESGALTQIVLSRAVQEQLVSDSDMEAEANVQEGDGTQNRRLPTTSVEAQTQTTELEQLSGALGSTSIPANAAAQGFGASVGGVGLPASSGGV